VAGVEGDLVEGPAGSDLGVDGPRLKSSVSIGARVDGAGVGRPWETEPYTYGSGMAMASVCSSVDPSRSALAGPNVRTNASLLVMC